MTSDRSRSLISRQSHSWSWGGQGGGRCQVCVTLVSLNVKKVLAAPPASAPCANLVLFEMTIKNT